MAGAGETGAGESSRCEDPAPTVGVGGEDIKTSAPNKTTRHAASLSSLHAALVRASTRYARHRPYQERNSNLAN